MRLSDQAISRFSSQHKIIKQYIDHLPPEALHKRFNSGRWSIHDTIAYLCRYQYVFLNRINLLCNSVDPYFEMYQSHTDPEFQFTAARSTGALLHEIYRIREHMIQLFKKLPENYGCRLGIHAVLGKMNLSQWLELFLLHETTQLFKIFKMAGRLSSSELKQDNVIQMPWLQQKIDEIA